MARRSVLLVAGCGEGKLASAQTLLDAAIGLDRDVDQGMRTGLTCDELRDSFGVWVKLVLLSDGELEKAL